MNRRYSLASLALAALGLLSACSKSDIYDGEYSKDGYYNESRVIYFPNSGADTIVVQNLALLEDNNGKVPLTFDVNLLGKLSSSPLSYKVELDKSRSTATSGEQIATRSQQTPSRAPSPYSSIARRSRPCSRRTGSTSSPVTVSAPSWMPSRIWSLVTSPS